MELEDKTIVCAECGTEFVHSADDQRRFQERGFANEPRRCPPCREKRRLMHAKAAEPAQAEGATATAASTKPAQPPQRPRVPGQGRTLGNRPPRSFERGFRDRRGNGGGGGGNAPVRESFEITCAECGKRTTVPFKPAGNRPVYCRDCYRTKRPPDSRPQTRTLDRSRPRGTFLPNDD